MNLIQLAREPRLSAFHVACSLPRDPEFRAWCRLELIRCTAEVGEPVYVEMVSVEAAADFIKFRCGIESRNELKADPASTHRFETLVRRPFVAWRSKQEMH